MRSKKRICEGTHARGVFAAPRVPWKSDKAKQLKRRYFPVTTNPQKERDGCTRMRGAVLLRC